MTHLHSALSMLIALIVFSGCSHTQRSVESISGRTMETTFSIKFVPGTDSPAIVDIGKAVDNELTSVNNQISAYQADAEIYQFNHSSSTDWFPVSKETASLVKLSLDFHKLSDGAFDVSVGPLVKLWRFGPDPRPQKIPEDSQIEEMLKFVGSDKLAVRLDPPAIKKQIAELQVDLSAIAKGHAVDRVAHKLESLGVKDYFVEIGGKIRTKGKRLDGMHWQVGIERPNLEDLSLHEVVGLPDASLATSSHSRNSIQLEGQRFTSMIDPKTGKPVESDLLSASVIMPDCASANAAATALMTVGLEKAIQLTEQQKWATLLVAHRNGKIETISSAEFERLTKRSR